jgi:hypothetical protein
VSTAGVVLDPSGIAISNPTREQFDPDVTSNGTDYFVAWTDSRLGNHDIYGARVSGTGTVLDATGLALCTEASNQYVPTVAFDGSSYVAAWPDYRGDTLWDIFVTQVTPSGTVVTPDGASVATNIRQYEPKVSIASPGGQQSLVVYSRYDTEPGQGSRRIRGRFISF